MSDLTTLSVGSQDSEKELLENAAAANAMATFENCFLLIVLTREWFVLVSYEMEEAAKIQGRATLIAK